MDIQIYEKMINSMGKEGEMKYISKHLFADVSSSVSCCVKFVAKINASGSAAKLLCVQPLLLRCRRRCFASRHQPFGLRRLKATRFVVGGVIIVHGLIARLRCDPMLAKVLDLLQRLLSGYPFSALVVCLKKPPLLLSILFLFFLCGGRGSVVAYCRCNSEQAR